MSIVVDSLVPSLIYHACEGDMPAFDRLRSNYHSRVVAFCTRLLRNHDDAEQAAQETFIKAWRCLQDYRYNLSFSAWLLKIAQNICLNIMRTQKYRASRSDASLDDPNCYTVVATCADTHNGVEERTMQIYSHHLLEALRQKVNGEKPIWDGLDWDIFLLRVGQGEENFAEIARQLAKSVDTVKYRYRARILPALEAVRRDQVVAVLRQERTNPCSGSRVSNWQTSDWQLLQIVYGEGILNFSVVSQRLHAISGEQQPIDSHLLQKRYENAVAPVVTSLEAELARG